MAKPFKKVIDPFGWVFKDPKAAESVATPVAPDPDADAAAKEKERKLQRRRGSGRTSTVLNTDSNLG